MHTGPSSKFEYTWDVAIQKGDEDASISLAQVPNVGLLSGSRRGYRQEMKPYLHNVAQLIYATHNLHEAGKMKASLWGSSLVVHELLVQCDRPCLVIANNPYTSASANTG